MEVELEQWTLLTKSATLDVDGNIHIEAAGGQQFSLQVDGCDPHHVINLMDRMKRGSFAKTPNENVILDSLSAAGLAAPLGQVQTKSGLEALLKIEDLQAEIMSKTLYANIFWSECQNNPSEVNVNVYYGMAIENYHFLFRESWFDSPVLSYQGSREARLLMNQFYAEEYGHDELILKALNEIGLSREDMADVRPLPETLALCNALAFWAANDPLFFFTTLGVLEGKDIKIDSYIVAMENSKKIAEEFISPIRKHSMINMDGEHGALTREIFKQIPVVTSEQMNRMIAYTGLFLELYDDFHTAVWNHYSNTKDLRARSMSRLNVAQLGT